MQFPLLLAFLLLTSLTAPCLAQRGLKDIPSTDPADQLASFKVADGFEVNLYASDPAIAKPIQINFDARGRLWVASSSIYPQIKPGQVADDKIIVLEDTDGDGAADKHTVFADGLLIPTAVIHDNASDYGAYVANSTELLHLTDTDGDGKADTRRVMLSGFGSEDTHHILHTFRWGVDGLLYMHQSIYIHSHIETPHGVRRLNGGGVWHFRPRTMEFEVFCKGQVNSWGHQQDRWGQSFSTDGAYNQGINYTFPGAVFATSPGAKRILTGLNRGQPKHCGMEILSGRHLPEDWRGTFVTNDFRGNRVNRFVLKEDGAAYQSIKTDDVLTSTHVAFRPVDVKMGPDGAIYIADWYNPIIQHGEVDFRDDRRDHAHGRIWRISAKDRPPVKTPKLVGASIDSLLEALRAPEDFTRLHAKLQLKPRDVDEVSAKLAAWVKALDVSDDQFEHLRLEALWTYQNLNVAAPDLLKAVLSSKDHRARAAAVRVLYHWHDRIPDALSLLARLIEDDHPRVRLEAVHALRRQDSLEAANIAMRALDHPVDEFTDFALWLTARELSHHWLPKLTAGEPVFGGNAKRLTFAIKAAESPQVVSSLVNLVNDGKLAGAQETDALTLLIALGGPKELRLVFDRILADPWIPNDPGEVNAARLLRQKPLVDGLLAAAAERKVKPSGDLSSVTKLIQESRFQKEFIRLAGLWQVEAARDLLESSATIENDSSGVKQASIAAIADLGGRRSHDFLIHLSQTDQPLATRMMAAVALAAVDLNAGATRIADILASLPDGANPQGVIRPLLGRKGGPAALAKALENRKLKPDVAKIALRTVQGSGQDLPELAAAIINAGNLSNPKRQLSPAEMAALVEQVQQRGDPARGEAVFRRADLRCHVCHAIGGAGGAVGPDMTSLGASAPVDYIIESLINPAAKVKEGYHSKQVFTKDGQVIVGVVQRKSDTHLILRTAEDEELQIPLATIDTEKDAPSLMPPGLIDGLTRPELIDLTAFLAQLGKEGRYKVAPQRLIRTWRTPIGTLATADFYRHHGIAGFPQSPEAVQWTPLYSKVDGSAPWHETEKVWINGPRYGLLRARIEVTTPGKIALKLNHTEGVELWLNQQRVDVSATTIIDTPKGTHTLTFALLEGKHPQGFVVELVDMEGSEARAQIITGK